MKLTYATAILLACLAVKACQDGTEKKCLRCYANQCLKCLGSFSNQNGLCNIPDTDIENCLFYASNGVCKQCQYGYSTSADGKSCAKISAAGCLALDANNKCMMCNNTFQLDPVTNACSLTQKCTIPGCASCGFKYGVETCFVCGSGWTIFTSFNYVATCIPQYPSLYNCKKAFYGDATLCLECNPGYYWTNKRCLPTTVQTLRYDNINLNSARVLSSAILAIAALLVANFDN